MPFRMSRVSSTLPIPPKMYRHFAVITLILTGCIALFADGESRQAMSDELESQRRQTAMAQASADQLALKGTPRREVRYRQRGGFDDTAGVADAAPVNDTSGTGQSVIGDNGISRSVNQSDLGVLGLPGLPEVRDGRPTKSRNKPIKPGEQNPGPTEAQRRAFQQAAEMPQ